MYETDENKNNGNLRMQNATGNETSAAPKYEENPSHINPQVYIVNKPMPIGSSLSEPLGNDPNVVYPLGNVSPNFNATTHRYAPSTPSTVLDNNINGNVPNTSNTGSAPNNNGNAP